MHLLSLETSACSTRKEQLLLGRPVCQHSFRQLLGIGSKRFAKCKRSASLGVDLPVDGRKRPRHHDSTNAESMRKRGLVVDFLEELYQCVSEPMPEAYQSFDVKHDGESSPFYVMPKMRFRRNRSKMPGKIYREKAARRLKDTPVRLLPPGSLTEYMGFLQAKHPEEKFSLKLLCSVPRFEILQIWNLHWEFFPLTIIWSHFEMIAVEPNWALRMRYGAVTSRRWPFDVFRITPLAPLAPNTRWYWRD